MTYLEDCRYCSIYSQAKNEDPIGTAGDYDHWFILEVPRPWGNSLYDFPPLLYLNQISRKLALQKGFMIKAVIVADDRDYSVADQYRIIHYHRPKGMLAKLNKKEYLLPNTDEAIALVKAILQQPQQLSRFGQYEQNTQHIRDILVCTHTKVDLACGRYGTPLYRKLRKEYAHRRK